MSENNQTSTTSTKSTGNGSNSSNSQSTGVNHGESYSKTFSEGTSQTWVTIQEEYRELSSRQFYSYQEQLERSKAWLAKLGVGEAIIKMPYQQSVPVRVPYIEKLSISKVKYQNFLRTLAKYNEFFIPKEEAEQVSHETMTKKEQKIKIELGRSTTKVQKQELKIQENNNPSIDTLNVSEYSEEIHQEKDFFNHDGE